MTLQSFEVNVADVSTVYQVSCSWNRKQYGSRARVRKRYQVRRADRDPVIHLISLYVIEASARHEADNTRCETIRIKAAMASFHSHKSL